MHQHQLKRRNPLRLGTPLVLFSLVSSVQALTPPFNTNTQRPSLQRVATTEPRLTNLKSSTKNSEISNNGSSAAATTTTNNNAAAAADVVTLTKITARAKVVYDGPEWNSLQDYFLRTTATTTSSSSSSSNKNKKASGNNSIKAAGSDYGTMTVVVGRNKDDQKLVGILSPTTTTTTSSSSSDDDDDDDEIKIYKHSMAKIPTVAARDRNKIVITDDDAIRTVIATLTSIQCTIPRITGVGGDTDNHENVGMVSGKVVIMGGSEYACFAAEGLAALGSHVTVVTTNPKLKLKHEKIEVIPPAVGDDEVGFASFLEEFDALLDTADDERPSQRGVWTTDELEDDADVMMSAGTTLRLLKQRHKCERYVSSMTKAQSIVNQEGVFFGPGKVKNYFQDIQKTISNQPTKFQSIVPPPSFGMTVETLLEKGIIYKNKNDFLAEGNKKTSNPLTLRGWSLKDFMEVSMWPQDSSGGGSRQVRFGLPVLDDEFTYLDQDEDNMISAPPPDADAKFFEKEAWEEGVAKEKQKRDDADERNPYVEKITGGKGLHAKIVKDQRDCVLFLSATFCRTCKSINPKFTTMARSAMEKERNDDVESPGILYAKADTTGDVGRDLGRLLKVDAVPAFQLFRNGKQFGPPLSISKLPSKKLDIAIALLESGFEWDSVAIQKAEGKM